MRQQRPVFIGGTNGSGTRLYARLLELNGVFQGNKKNYAFEPETIIQYTKPLVPKLLKQTGSAVYNVNDLPENFRITMENWIRKAGQEIQSTSSPESTHWGWKHPRNMFLIPLLNHVYPECYYLHVVRDGRDMVFANNKTDARVLFHDLATNKKNLLNRVRNLLKPSDLQPYQYLEFWSMVNCAVADWCKQHLASRFVISRFEDLCAQPDFELPRIAKAMQIEIDPAKVDQCKELVKSPDSIGQWQTSSVDIRNKLLNSKVQGLTRFGYIH